MHRMNDFIALRSNAKIQTSVETHNVVSRAVYMTLCNLSDGCNLTFGISFLAIFIIWAYNDLGHNNVSALLYGKIAQYASGVADRVLYLFLRRERKEKLK